MRTLFLVFAFALTFAARAAAQTCPANMVASADVSDATRSLVVVLTAPAGVNRSQPLAGTVTVNGVTTAVAVTTVSPRRLIFNLPQIYTGGTVIGYSLTTATFTCSAAGTVSGSILVQGNKELTEALLGKIAYAKTADEKDIFGSFVAAHADGGGTAGAADIVINRDLTQGSLPSIGSLFDTAFTTIRIKKTSAEHVDPRAFDASVTLQKTLLLGAARNYLLACSQSLTSACLTAQTESGFTKFFRTLLFDEALRLESDAFSFESVNFVSDTHMQLGSVAKAVTQAGYFSLRFHAGAEIGRSLQKPTTAAGTATVSTTTVDWVRRGKGGVEATFRLLPGDNTGNKWAVEVSAQTVFRRLLSDEVFIEQVTNANNETVPSRVSVGKGNKPWRQFDAKVFVFSNDTARYGFRLSYMNGSLPPTFKSTKGFTFGFVVESADDTSSGAPANGAG